MRPSAPSLVLWKKKKLSISKLTGYRGIGMAAKKKLEQK
jgi:hypothetical protein